MENGMEHSLIYEKGKVTISGVKNVDVFGEKEIVLTLTDGVMDIRGNKFTLSEMASASGKISFCGVIVSLVYRQGREKTSFIKKLFK